MPRIVDRHEPAGVLAKIERLALQPLVDELSGIVEGFDLAVKEEVDSNGGGGIRKMFDARFRVSGGWDFRQTGGIDWIKGRAIDAARVAIGVEIQFSARSDLMIVDIDHLRQGFMEGAIDVGFLVVPSTRLAPFLTDRIGSFTDAKRAIERARASDHPIIVWGVDHDRAGDPIAKARTRQGRSES